MMNKFELKRHGSFEAVQLAYYGEGVTRQQLINGKTYHQDENGKEVVLTWQEENQAVQNMGYWGFVDTANDTRVIHFWTNENANFKDILHFFAHEIGHGTGTQLDDELQEEFRAETFASVADLAFSFAAQFFEMSPRPCLVGE